MLTADKNLKTPKIQCVKIHMRVHILLKNCLSYNIGPEFLKTFGLLQRKVYFNMKYIEPFVQQAGF
jgi:hypothetical protein